MKIVFSISTVSAPSNVNYTLSVSTDPLSGPYNSTFNISAGTAFQLRMTQLTAGPQSYVCVSFGDGSPLQNFTFNVETYLNITFNYTIGGTYIILAYPVGLNSSFSVVNNNITVNVASPPIYNSKTFFMITLLIFYTIKL
jgi:hypothetical protein